MDARFATKSAPTKGGKRQFEIARTACVGRRQGLGHVQKYEAGHPACKSGFGLLVLLMAAISLVAFSRLGLVRDGVNDVVERRYPSTEHANNVISYLSEAAIILRDVSRMESLAQARQELARIPELSKKLTAALEGLEAGIATDEEQQG
jgi:hypothetical protein